MIRIIVSSPRGANNKVMSMIMTYVLSMLFDVSYELVDTRGCDPELDEADEMIEYAVKRKPDLLFINMEAD